MSINLYYSGLRLHLQVAFGEEYVGKASLKLDAIQEISRSCQKTNGIVTVSNSLRMRRPTHNPEGAV